MKKPKKVIAASKTHPGKNLGLKHLGNISNLKPRKKIGLTKTKAGKTPAAPKTTRQPKRSIPKSTHLNLKGLTTDV
jgi:hypothetical protein